MTREEIIAGLAEILNEVADVEPAEVSEEKAFIEDLDVDSLAMVEVIVAVEERFGVSLPEEELKELRLVSDIVLRVEKQLTA
ncbi:MULTISPECIES: acyl carrier protein [Streptomyces]|uniref:Acyl carrier protein n=2 Tax=Streptomyces rimosus subsp. rimosus TaxID=132474 RepID=L8ET39_STRR1|nr:MULTISPECIES: acyl carrier protein [Streptomyces]KOG66546.1 acyl carrier protein [Streptomyces griseoflavus]KOG68249.1 acyl carrier protein [Kitasatospora aureofaciens]MYT43508.1 acyl carrier protein [Streptomyces sp. SID5471]KEF02149.1 acyl carrier protein [Streptomyces rimosus]KEF18519.1 acyl carrier protein [Streptomyces rimosus]